MQKEERFITNRDIVIVGLQPWDIEIGSNCKNIALELAKHNRVLYVNPPLDRSTRLKHKSNPRIIKRLELVKRRENLVKVNDNMWNLYPPSLIQSINWLPSTQLFRVMNKRNNRLFAKDIKQAITQLGFKDFILFNDSDMFRSYHLPEMLNPALSIYYSRDNLMVHKYWFKHGHILEPELVKKSTLVVANSLHLANEAGKHNPSSYYVGQGCDFSLFNPDRSFTMPEDMKTIRRPIIGYIGAVLSHRLDMELLVELCRRKPEWSFVFVGKPDAEFAGSSLNQAENVHFLGLKEEKQLPDYLAFFDVAMNPQAINEYTIGNYPRKIDEYLALGKPVVATLTETMRTFEGFTYLGKSVDDYIRLIEKALSENSPELEKERIAFARTHTWENSAQAIYQAMARHGVPFSEQRFEKAS